MGPDRWPARAVRAAATAVRLLGPVLVPSWRFFDVVGPSPRVEYAVLQHAAAEPAQWHRLALTLPNVSLTMLLWHLLYNAERNDLLFLVSCCERVLEASSGDATASAAVHAASSASVGAQQEILLRALRHAHNAGLLPLQGAAERCLRLRILQVRRVDNDLRTELAFSSEAVAVAELADRVPALRALR